MIRLHGLVVALLLATLASAHAQRPAAESAVSAAITTEPATPFPDRRLRSLDSARKTEDKCNLLVEWLDRVYTEFPAPNGSIRRGTVPMERGAAAYRDEDFVQLFGKPFDELTPKWRKEFWDDVLRRCYESDKPGRPIFMGGAEGIEQYKVTFARFRPVLDAGFSPQGSPEIIIETLRFGRLARTWMNEQLAALPGGASLESFSALPGRAAEAKNELVALWPSEELHFQEVVAERQRTVADAVLTAWVSRPPVTTFEEARKVQEEPETYEFVLRFVEPSKREEVTALHEKRLEASLTPLFAAQLEVLATHPSTIAGIQQSLEWKTTFDAVYGPTRGGSV